MILFLQVQISVSCNFICYLQSEKDYCDFQKVVELPHQAFKKSIKELLANHIGDEKLINTKPDDESIP